MTGERVRLWVASELYYPEETSTGYFLTRIAEGLADNFDVQIISGRPAYSERGTKVTAYEERRGTRIYRMPATRFDKDIIPLRLLNLVTFSLATFVFALFKIRRGDLVLVVTNPPTLPLVVGLAGRLRGARLSLLVHDIYPEVLDASGTLNPTGTLYRILEAVFRGLFRGFERIFVLGRDAEEAVARKIRSGAERIRIIPNWADIEEVFPLNAQENHFRNSLGLQDKIIIQFSGNIGRTHDVETILEAAEQLKDDPRFHFLFFGYGAKSNFVSERAAKLHLSNVDVLPRQPREKLNQMLNACDAVVIALVDKMFGLSVPSRMYNVMAAGKPIIAIAHPRSELCRTIEDASAGWPLPGCSGTDLAQFVRQLGEEEEMAKAKAYGANARELVAHDFTLGAILDLYRKELGQLAGDRAT